MNRRQVLAPFVATVPPVGFERADGCYTWSPKTRPSKATEFVPMIKGEWSLRQTDDIKRMGGIAYLLGFNDPERSKQGNLSLERYAYFNPGRGKPHSLLKNDGSLTRIGELYRDAAS